MHTIMYMSFSLTTIAMWKTTQTKSNINDKWKRNERNNQMIWGKWKRTFLRYTHTTNVTCTFHTWCSYMFTWYSFMSMYCWSLTEEIMSEIYKKLKMCVGRARSMNMYGGHMEKVESLCRFYYQCVCMRAGVNDLFEYLIHCFFRHSLCLLLLVVAICLFCFRYFIEF